MRRYPLLLCLVAVLFVHPEARAARPFVVDDARIVDKGACQIEAWHRNNADGSGENWALPACNPFGRVELTFGGGNLTALNGSPRQTDYQLQAKTLFKPLETNQWGWGLAAGVVRHADINLQPNLIGNYYFYVPISRSLADDRVVLLANIGGLDNRDIDRRGVSWGIGAELYLTPRVMFAAETYGATGFDRFAQIGARLWLVPDHVQLDASYGGNIQNFGAVHWTSIGVRLISKPFF